jgi:hypothetical protein
MPLRLFAGLCVVIVVLTLLAMARSTPWQRLLTDYFLLAGAGFVGEESAITLYRYYAYADGWDLRIFDVPLLVPLIWPLVILSARGVCRGLFPEASLSGAPAITAAIVVFDASLVEVLAVRAGLWSWAEGGHLGVPLIGILGWGFFAYGAERVMGRLVSMPSRAAVLLLAPLIAHALIVLSWWGCLRWVGRGALGDVSLLGLVVIASAVTALVVRARRNGNAIPFEVAWPRVFAAALFFALLVSAAPTDLRLWLHVACAAIPYVLATRWPARRSAPSVLMAPR